MLKFRLISPSLIIVCAFAGVVAQTADHRDEEKLKQQNALLEQIAKDADALRLPENRALVLAKLGDSFWATDEKRARQLFQTAINALVAAQIDAETEKKQPGVFFNLIDGVSPRQEIMTMIAGRDAELALDAFYRSRPAKVAQALTAAANGAEKKDSENRQYALNETSFEQGLISRFSDQSPPRALKLFRESLAKGVTYEALNLIEKLKTKNSELAAQLAAEVAGKLLATDFEKDSQAASLTLTFVGEYGKKSEADAPVVKVDDKILRDLTAKFVKNILKSEDGDYDVEYILPTVEKYAPESLAALKQRKAKYDKENKREDYAAFSKLMEGDPSPEKLLSEADKYSEEFKSQIYYSAAEKLAQSGNVERAKKIISSRLPEGERENYLTQINYNLIQQAITAEKYDEAALLINQIPAEGSRFYFFMQLAATIYHKNPAENKRPALSVIEQARALISQPIETLDDLTLMMQVAATLAEIDPEQSFQVLENLTYQMNEFLEASAIVSRYRNDGSVRKGEMIVNSYGSVNGLNNMAQILTTLRKKDFTRTAAYVNGFQRLEVRVSLEMQLVETAAPPLSAPSGSNTGSAAVGKAQ